MRFGYLTTLFTPSQSAMADQLVRNRFASVTSRSLVRFESASLVAAIPQGDVDQGEMGDQGILTPGASRYRINQKTERSTRPPCDPDRSRVESLEFCL